MRGAWLVGLVLVGAVARPAGATWSVVAADRRTGEVAIASATCVAQDAFARFPAKGLMDIQAIVVPGKAVAAAQAGVDRTRRNQQLVYRELVRGTPPAAILAMLAADPAIETRQFGIVDLLGRTAGYSGARNGRVSLHETGRLDDAPIFYAIQGNILASERVVIEAVRAFRRATGSLADRVMAAMEAADREGGDRRCSCETPPRVNAPCHQKTAHVAYLLVARPTDTNRESYNDGAYSLYLSVTDQDIQPTEDANPVATLRMRYEAWKRSARP
jgi:uncharacterized Ntn-hydrolase superfamily protein